MQDLLANSELFEGVDAQLQSRLLATAGRESVPKGDYLFLLGDYADRVFVLLEGEFELCFPLSVGGAVKDIAVETLDAGRIFGLSALVKPYRFTLSARAAETSKLATLARADLLQLAKDDPQVGCAFYGRIAEVLGRRFLTMRALWAREVQRSINSGGPAVPNPESR